MTNKWWPIVTIDVDFNWVRVHNGVMRTLAFLDDADGHFAIGEVILAVADRGTEAQTIVAMRVDEMVDRGMLYLVRIDG